jgi:hypothetical protein
MCDNKFFKFYDSACFPACSTLTGCSCTAPARTSKPYDSLWPMARVALCAAHARKKV